MNASHAPDFPADDSECHPDTRGHSQQEGDQYCFVI
jgi:hypothetical protein